MGHLFSRDALGGAKVAIIGFCPMPTVLKNYSSLMPLEQFFIHVAPESVRILTCGVHKVVSLHHVYGGPVGSATVEELAYYGVKYILAYGLAGSLKGSVCPMGEYYLVKDAIAADGTTRHYTQAQVVHASQNLAQLVDFLWRLDYKSPMHVVRAATSDAIYRESNTLLQEFRLLKCDIVNLDTAHLYAVSRNNMEDAIESVQCGVVSDTTDENNGDGETKLGVMLATNDEAIFNPMQKVNNIVEFYLNKVVPRLLNDYVHNDDSN